MSVASDVVETCLTLVVLACVGCQAATWSSTDDCDDGFRLAWCPRTLPNVSDCLREALQTNMHSLMQGNKEFDISSIDPLLVQQLDLNLSSKETIRISNLVVTGTSDVLVEKLISSRPSNSTVLFDFQFYIPHVVIKGQYGRSCIRERRGTVIIELRDYRLAFQLTAVTSTEQDKKQYLIFTSCLSQFINATSVKVQLLPHGSAPIVLSLAPDNAAFRKSFEEKQPKIVLAMISKIFEYVPSLDVWLASNITEPSYACARRRFRSITYPVDVFGRGF